MIILHTVAEVRAHLDAQRAQGKTVGIIGTTGSLHDGHLSLVRQAKVDCDVAVMFWAGTLNLAWAEAAGSLPSYTPDMQRDLDLAEANGLDVCFILNRADLYSEPMTTFISAPSFAEAPGRLEDPAHLSVVATMVTVFSNIAGPCKNYFGEKDWQQLAMLKKLEIDLFLCAEIVGCPTVREADGVATSSRNQKLTPANRAAAPIIYRGLQAAVAAVTNGERDAAKVAAAFTNVVEPVAPVNYVKVVDAKSLAPLDKIEGEARILVSASFGDVRLVDNIGVTPPD